MIPVLLLAALATASNQKQLEAADKSCLARLELGDVEAARATCGALAPASHPIAAYWRALLEKDSTALRKLLDPAALGKLDPPGKRLLLLAGRYQFAAGDAGKLDEVATLLKARYPKAAELDTLERLRKAK